MELEYEIDPDEYADDTETDIYGQEEQEIVPRDLRERKWQHCFSILGFGFGSSSATTTSTCTSTSTYSRRAARRGALVRTMFPLAIFILGAALVVRLSCQQYGICSLNLDVDENNIHDGSMNMNMNNGQSTGTSARDLV